MIPLFTFPGETDIIRGMNKIILFAAMSLVTALPAAPIRVVVWDEQQPEQRPLYTNFIGNHLAAYLRTLPDLSVKSVCFNDPDQGLADETLTNCDVLIWWSHGKNNLTPQEQAREIAGRVKDGRLALIALHSALTSRPFIEAMNERTREHAARTLPADVKTEFILPKAYRARPADPLTPRIEMTNAPDGSKLARVFLPICDIVGWHEVGLPSHVTTLMPDHPIARGLPAQFDLPKTEVYVEPFHVPKPDAVLFQETWDRYGAFRSVMLWKVGKGEVLYFRPGHETYPVYFDANVLKIIGNAVEWMGRQSVN